VGTEYFVTPTDDSGDANSLSLKTMQSGESFAIPPGQLAYVITHETVNIPKNVLAFISIRVSVKWKGLVNVSGFHVDPGYRGRLTFSVYNAGSASIHLRSGDAVFLIWFADLDGTATEFAKTPKDTVPEENSRINIGTLAPTSGELHSLNGLANRIKDTKEALDKRITALESASGIYRVAAGAVLTICLALGVKLISDWMHPEAKAPPVMVVMPTPPPATTMQPPFRSPVGGQNAAKTQEPHPAPPLLSRQPPK